MPNDIVEILTNAGAGTSGTGGTTGTSGGQSAEVLKQLTDRLTKQGKGISTSSSSDLQTEIEKAMSDITTAGALTKSALQSEAAREGGFARDRASAIYTGAMEGRTGYATQVAGLRELTDTTEKSVRDLDARYQEAILKNDANTATQLASLRIQKLEFQAQQEQNFYSNLISLGNLQEQSLSRQQQNEQFWIDKQEKEKQFVIEMATSNYQFERNYGLSLRDMDIKEQQLEIDRDRFNLSVREYNDKKKEIAAEKERLQTKSIVGNEIKNSLRDPATGKLRTREQLLSTQFMLKVKEETGFDGTTEELSSLINEAYDDVASDTTVTEEATTTTQPSKGGGMIDWFSSTFLQESVTDEMSAKRRYRELDKKNPRTLTTAEMNEMSQLRTQYKIKI